MRWLAGIMGWLWPTLALAAESGSEGLLPSGLKLMAALGLVLGLLLVAYAVIRRKTGFFSPARAGVIKVVETRYLGPKKALCVVEVRGEEFLLGVGQERIELISRLERKKAPSFEETLQGQELNR